MDWDGVVHWSVMLCPEMGHAPELRFQYIYIYNMVMYNYEPHLNHWILGTLFSGKISMFWL